MGLLKCTSKLIILVSATFLTGSASIAQDTAYINVSIPLMRQIIKDVESGETCKQILIERDSLLKEKDLQNKIRDSISVAKDIQVFMLYETAINRTNELNVCLTEQEKKNKKIGRKNNKIAALILVVLIESVIIGLGMK